MKNMVVKPLQTLRPFVPIVALLFVSALSGCSIFTIDTMRNEPLPPSSSIPPQRTKASETIEHLPNDVFIGIAMSGGGSRATNFAAAVLLELQKLGILQHTAVISSVSGSSLAAAYYGLYGAREQQWNESAIRKQFRKNFENVWFTSWFFPWNVARYWTSNFSRSDIMIQVLDNELFDGKSFKDFNPVDTPKILINATSYTSGRNFVFSDEYFAAQLNSRLDTYPIANAIMASSAFPGAFHDVTLKDYAIKNRELAEVELGTYTQNYEHLIDGGPSDNLGITAIKRVLKKLYRSADKPKPKPKSCFLFVIDAYPYREDTESIQQADTRHWYDFFFDTNVANSSDVLLSSRRVDLMKELGLSLVASNLTPFKVSQIAYDEPDEQCIRCHIWHLSFQRMYATSFDMAVGSPENQQLLHNARRVVNSVPTRYKLDSVQGYSPETVQDYLFKVANILVKQDRIQPSGKLIYREVCDRMKESGLNDLTCD